MKSDLVKRIEELKKERNAVILAHNYQLPEVQDVADFLGDSLALSRLASQQKAEVIVFCGVKFMAETAVIVNPEKTVLLPEPDAGCQLADMLSADDLRQMKEEHPGAIVVCYVNSSVEVKAESDYCCTSANAVEIVKSLPAGREILFVPDRYLGLYVAKKTGRELILTDAYCPVHQRIFTHDIQRLKEEFPKAEVMVHPECSPEVIAQADQVFSTGGMCRYPGESKAKEFIVGTEIGMLYRLRKMHPSKRFYPASEAAVCPHMKLIELEKVLRSLEGMIFAVEIPENIRQMAIGSVERMFSVVK